MGTPNKIRDYADEVGLPYKEAVVYACKKAKSIKGAAKLIGMNRVNLHDFIKRHEIEIEITRTYGGQKSGVR
jgi:molybdenum-dependent DNA-binding transcriptional regulator ModE